MRKLLSLLTAAAAVFSLSVVSFAAESEINAAEQRILDKLGSKVTVGDRVLSLSTSNINTVKDFLRQVDLDDSKADAVIAEVDAALELVKAEGEPDLSKLSSETKSKIFDHASAACNVVGVTLTLTADNQIEATYTDASGQQVKVTVTPSMNSEPVDSSSSGGSSGGSSSDSDESIELPTTGATQGVVAFGAFALVAAGCAVAAKKMKLF